MVAKVRGAAGRDVPPAESIDFRDVHVDPGQDAAPRALLALAMNAMHAPQGPAREAARNRCRAVVAMFERLVGAATDEILARRTRRPRWDLRRTTIVVHHARIHEDPAAAPREVTIDVGAGVELSRAARAQLRDHAHAVASAVLGAPAPGQRTEVEVRAADAGIPALDHALGVGPAGDALWRAFVDDVARAAAARSRARARADRRTRQAR
ncbi:MAG: hypothetical protein JNM10_05115 [Planctomycetia bacterium]|nr:hypothetical protein [Planctomycetia bacterium]